MPLAVVKVAVDADCDANGIVTNKLPPLVAMFCNAESEISSGIAAVPVLVVIVPMIDPGTSAAVTGTVPNAPPESTPVITVAP